MLTGCLEIVQLPVVRFPIFNHLVPVTDPLTHSSRLLQRGSLKRWREANFAPGE